MNTRYSTPRRRHLAACVVLALGAADAAHATTYNVQDCSDGNGTQTLRYLMTHAVDGDTIQIDGEVCSHITLSQQTSITLNSNVTLQGSGADQVTITGGGDSIPPVLHSVFYHMGTGTFQISGVTLRDATNFNSNVAEGGCVYSTGNVSIQNSVLTNCEVEPPQVMGGVHTFPKGGAVYAKGSITLSHSTVSGNLVDGPTGSLNAGGGIYAAGGADIEYSTISNNRVVGAFCEGGGASVNGSLKMLHSTVSGNSALQGEGGGLDLFLDSNATISYSTISDNSAGVDSAVRVESNITPSPYTMSFINTTISGNRATYYTAIDTDRPTIVRNSTIAFNHAGFVGTPAGLHTTSTLQAFSSIFANNENYDIEIAYPAAPVISGSGNLINSTNASVPLGTLSSCAKLEALEPNGGDVETMALQSDSPAINQGNLDGGALTTDERGEPRNVGGVDIGAYERQPNAPPDDRIFQSAFSSSCN